ncbi:MAG: hypothetical protein CVV44_03955 [Spirochaetae bacterium HGW-Spirochaetae-1]|jgi:hypothetical protein|nr:MAG: hypothetical protein CVV44_03955 [Spirochaetae bacterium HGW-Spirochaetae-1]
MPKNYSDDDLKTLINNLELTLNSLSNPLLDERASLNIAEIERGQHIQEKLEAAKSELQKRETKK